MNHTHNHNIWGSQNTRKTSLKAHALRCRQHKYVADIILNLMMDLFKCAPKTKVLKFYPKLFFKLFTNSKQTQESISQCWASKLGFYTLSFHVAETEAEAKQEYSFLTVTPRALITERFSTPLDCDPKLPEIVSRIVQRTRAVRGHKEQWTSTKTSSIL